ncbi:MAG: hypothetical protein JWN52_2341 [Actinomycetia bacterium]|nr:hypothetical protein [Actinomycetes bacterium]
MSWEWWPARVGARSLLSHGVSPLDRLGGRRVLAGLARNPSAPEEVVLRLVNSPAASEVACRCANITEGLADELLGLGDVQVACYLGYNNRLPTAIRWRLATHPDPTVRATAPRRISHDRVMSGCEIPVSLLERLAGDPDPQVRKEVAAHYDTPAGTRRRLAADLDPQVRAAVSQWWTDPPPEVHRALLTDAEPAVRAAALSPWHPPPPEDLHPLLLTDPLTCADVVPHLKLTHERTATLAASTDEAVRAALAAHPELPEETRQSLAADPEITVRICVLLSRHTPEGTRARLHAALTDSGLGRADSWITSYYLGNAWKDQGLQGWVWDAPLQQRLAYLNSPYPFLRRAAAAPGGLPIETVMRLLKDPDIQVRRIAARGATNVPGQELERLVREHGEDPSVSPRLVEHPNFPPQAFPRLAQADQAHLRGLALHSDDLPAALVDALATDPEPSVRCAAAQHRNLSASCLPTLLTDDDPQVVEAAGAAPAFPIPWMHQLLDAIEAPDQTESTRRTHT